LLERVWKENQHTFRCIILSVLSDHSIIDDVLQDAYVRILSSKNHFDDEKETLSFLRHTVFSSAVDLYRYRKRRTRLATQGMESSCFVKDRPPTPQQYLLHAEHLREQTQLLKEVQKALETLTPEQREAIDIIFRRNGIKVKEVCRQAGIPYSTVRSRMLAGIDRIRRQLRLKGITENPLTRNHK
jgi:RNA polymerase sigma-70 factor (ECF subfamily)